MKRIETYDVFGIPAEQIYYDGEFNCRGEFTVQSVKELSESIGQHGLQFPVVVQPIQDAVMIGLAGYQWRLLAGHRRFKAITLYLKWPEIPAMIRYGLSEHQARVLNFTENLERKDLNPLEEAIAISRLYREGISPSAIAAELKKSYQWVYDRMLVLRMPEQVQQLVAARRVTLLDLKLLARQVTPEEQIKTAEAIAASKRGPGGRRKSSPEFARSFRHRRSKSEINLMIGEMFKAGISGLPTRVATWCAGFITDDELREDIRMESATKDRGQAS
jgi:ParB/RepB/Spo0J family partition protein